MKEKHFSHCFLLKMFILNINRKENIIHGKFFDLLFIAVCVLHLSLICVQAFCSIYIRLQSILYLEYFLCTHFFFCFISDSCIVIAAMYANITHRVLFCLLHVTFHWICYWIIHEFDLSFPRIFIYAHTHTNTNPLNWI